MVDKVASLAEAAALVADGDRIGFGGSNAVWRRPLAFVRELVRQGRRGLHLHNMIGGVEIDLLVGAGAVASTNCCYVGLDEFGRGERFQRAAASGAVEVNEYSEFTFVAGLRAAGMDIPFMPWKTAWGTDVVRQRGWQTTTCPYTGKELLAVPAADIDVTVIHAVRADRSGNVEMAVPLDFIYDFDLLIARASRRVIVCAERIEEIPDKSRISMIGREVECVVETPRGAWPGGLAGNYPADGPHLNQEYVPAGFDDDLFASYIERFVMPEEADLVS